MKLPLIGAESETLIIQEETGGQVLYEKTEQSTDWPGGLSGVTVACGYDCGYASATDISDDWAALLSATAIAHLQATCGVHGRPARSLAHELKGQVTVPWEMALAVFRKRDIPKYSAMVVSQLEHCEELPPNCFGVLLSITFNRGPHWSTPERLDPHGRFAEMRAITGLMQIRRFDLIPQAILSMQRIWPKGGDLWKRRAHEATLFQRGL